MTQKAEATRAQIVQSAYRLFLENGYSATSMRNIVSASGVTMGGIYNHFANKEEIFSAVFQQNHPFKWVLPSMAQAEGDTLEALVRDVARRMLKALGDSPDALKLMFTEVVEFRGCHMAQSFEEGAHSGVLELMNRFLAFQDQIRPIPPFTLARSFIGFFFSFFITGMFLPPQFLNPEKDFDLFVEIYLNGILEPK